MPTTMTPYKPCWSGGYVPCTNTMELSQHERDASIRLAKINETIRRHKPSEPEQYLTPNTNRRTTASQLSGWLKSSR